MYEGGDKTYKELPITRGWRDSLVITRASGHGVRPGLGKGNGGEGKGEGRPTAWWRGRRCRRHGGEGGGGGGYDDNMRGVRGGSRQGGRGQHGSSHPLPPQLSLF